MIRWFMIALILVGSSGCTTLPVVPPPQREPAPLHLEKRPRVALVLGGGAARGFAHIGVIKALEKAGIPIDLIVGSSAGSIVGALYADSGNAHTLEKAMRKRSFFDIVDFSWFGLVSGDKLQHYMSLRLDSERFDQLKIPLVIVATDLANGQLKILSSGQIVPAVNASCAMPGVVRPVDLYGSRLIDGGMVAPVPVNVAKRYNPMMIIAVNIESDFSKVLPTSSVGILSRALDVCFHVMTKQEVVNADITIHPVVGDVMFDLSKKHKLILSGEVAAEKALPEIKAQLKRHKIK